MSDVLFRCRRCSGMFSVPVWECRCGHHNHAGDPQRLCGGCHILSRPGPISRVAAKDWKRVYAKGIERVAAS